MDKILVSASGKPMITTNDGATILNAIQLDNPAANLLISISRNQDKSVGDGTTSVTVLAGELLREAEKLLNQNIHPQTVVTGWQEASRVALEALENFATIPDDEEAFRKNLFDVAKTTLSSKILNADRDFFARLCVDAILRLRGRPDLKLISFIKVTGGSLLESYLDDGFIINKKIGIAQPRKVKNCKVLLMDTHLDRDKVKIQGSQIKVDSAEKVAAIEEAERHKMITKVEKISQHGCNVVINRQLIYDFPEQLFADKGIVSIAHADFIGTEQLSAALGGDIVSTFETPELVTLGEAELLEEIMIGEERLLKFTGCKDSAACTVVLRGASTHVLEEAERSIHDVICVLQQMIEERRIVYGGGCSETLMSVAVDDLAARTPGKKSLAIAAFAVALRKLPEIIARNAGYDAPELVSRLRAAHVNGDKYAGLNMYEACVGDMKELAVTESYKVKSQVVLSAAEAAEQIVRCDTIHRCAPRQQAQ
eukprot:TRINITY_DN3099_c0_g1_i3.p1 TRINITY_DN3099_c0_g1~~TRINITY_DN3099_c0_g1_i3.p1  ORF type:complete len:482 (-),score=186.33 TRINITY_DN3099_c0_g1_i3:1193-2638(-)